MKIKKKIWGCLLSLLCIFMLVLPVMASESPETDSEVSAVTSEESAVPTENPAIPEERQKPLLVDDAGLLTEEESSALLNKLEDISQKYENEVGIVTVNSLEGKTAEAYADDYYDYNGYGYGENDDGLLILISMGEREWAISTYGYSHTVAFTDAGLEFISGEFKSKLSSGNYADAFNCFADQCDDFLRQAATGEPYDVDNMPSKGKVHPFWLVTDLVVAFLISFGLVKSKSKNLKSVKKQESAEAYERKGSMSLRRSTDSFVNRIVTQRTIRNEKDSSSSSSGGSSSHTSSSGRSHGGASGKF